MYLRKASHVNMIIHFLKKQCSLNLGSPVISVQGMRSFLAILLMMSQNQQITKEVSPDVTEPHSRDTHAKSLAFYFLPFSFLGSISPVRVGGLSPEQGQRAGGFTMMERVARCEQYCQRSSRIEQGSLVSIWETERLRR